MPIPSPSIIPSDLASKGLTFSLGETAGVLLNDMKAMMVLSVSTPPVSIMSERCSTSSLIAIFKAPKELAQAASTTQFIPPKFKRLAIRPATTLANIPGKAFSSHFT